MYRDTSLGTVKARYKAYKQSPHLSYQVVSSGEDEQFLIDYLDSRFQYISGGSLSYTSFPYRADKLLIKAHRKEHRLCLDIAQTLAKRRGGSAFHYLMPKVQGVCLPEGSFDLKVNLSDPVWILSDDQRMLIHSSCIKAICPEVDGRGGAQALVVVHGNNGGLDLGYQFSPDERRRLIDHSEDSKALYEAANLLFMMDQFKKSSMDKTLPPDSLKLILDCYLRKLYALDNKLLSSDDDQELIGLRKKIISFLGKYKDPGLAAVAEKLRKLLKPEDKIEVKQLAASIEELKSIRSDFRRNCPQGLFNSAKFIEASETFGRLQKKGKLKGQDPIGYSYLDTLSYIETIEQDTEVIRAIFAAAVRRSNPEELALLYQQKAHGLAKYCFDDACRLAMEKNQHGWFGRLLAAAEFINWPLILEPLGRKCEDGQPEFLNALPGTVSPAYVVYQMIKNGQTTNLALYALLAKPQLSYIEKIHARTLLQWAVFYKQFDLFGILCDEILKQGKVNPEQDGFGLGKALARACFDGQTAILNKGLQIGGFDLNARYSRAGQTRTIAESLVFYKDYQGLAELVRRGLNPFVAASGRSLIDYIIEREDTKALETVIKSRKESDLLAMDSYEEIALRLLDKNLFHLVQVLLAQGCVTIDSVLRYQVDPRGEASTLIIDPNSYLQAALVKNPASAWSQFLFAHPGIDLFAKIAEQTVFHILVNKGAWTKVRDLLTDCKNKGVAGDKLEEVVCYVLIHAALNKQAKLIDLCMEFKFNPNSLLHQGMSVLHYAIQAGNEPLIAALLDRGADPLRGDPSAKDYAAKFGYQNALVLIDQSRAKSSGYNGRMFPQPGGQSSASLLANNPEETFTLL